jgi:hypothetical protein
VSLSSVYDSVLRISFAAPGRVDQVPVPTPGGAAPSELTAKVLVAINLVAWAGTAAGVVGVLVCGVTMAISHRRGEGSEHMGRLGLVLGGCVLVATAGPIVQWFM